MKDSHLRALRAIALKGILATLVASCSCGTGAEPGPDAGHLPDAHAALDSGGTDSAVLDASRDAHVADSGMDGPDGHEPDAGVPCEYPVVWVADPATRAGAETSLAALAPSAAPTWDERRGTFASIFGLEMPLDCPAGGDVWVSVRELIENHPTIFQIDLSEWEVPIPYPCTAVGALVNFVRLNRAMLGSQPVVQDFVSFAVARIDGQVQLRAFVGGYLPPVPSSVADLMAACAELTVAGARDAVHDTTFPYTTFAACVPTGSGEYVADAADTVELDAEAHWTWIERDGVSGVELTKQHLGRLIVHPDNVTPTLQSSDANCPEEVGDGREYGFRIIFDVVRREILSKLPGLGCVVC